MKKSIMIAVSLVPLFFGKAYAGYSYLGAGIGGDYIKTNVSTVSEVPSELGLRQNPQIAKFGPIFQIHGGHVKNFGSSFLMGEILFRPQGAAAQGSQYSLYNSAPDKYQTESVSLTRLYTLGVAAKFGKSFEASQWGAFASLGLLASQFQFKQTVVGTNLNGNLNGSHTTSSTRFAIAPGVGVLYDGIDKVSLRFEYACEIYQTVKGKTFITPSPSIQTEMAKTNPLYHTFMVTLSRKF